MAFNMPNFVSLGLFFQGFLYHSVKGEPSRLGMPYPAHCRETWALGTGGRSPGSLDLSCLVRVSWGAWGLERCHVACAIAMIYGGGLGPCDARVTSGVAGDRVTRVGHLVLRSRGAEPQKTLDAQGSSLTGSTSASSPAPLLGELRASGTTPLGGTTGSSFLVSLRPHSHPFPLPISMSTLVL